MSPPLRHVRPTRQFYNDLHRQLGPERGPGGEPSRVDFELYDLVMIFEVFATGERAPAALRAASGDR